MDTRKAWKTRERTARSIRSVMTGIDPAIVTTKASTEREISTRIFIARDSATDTTAGSTREDTANSISKTGASAPSVWRVRRQLPDRRRSREPCRVRHGARPPQFPPAQLPADVSLQAVEMNQR